MPSQGQGGGKSSSDDGGRTTRKKMSMLRRKIASHLVNAQQTAAILTTFNEVDMSAIMQPVSYTHLTLPTILLV